jgi:hypothetical protein
VQLLKILCESWHNNGVNLTIDTHAAHLVSALNNPLHSDCLFNVIKSLELMALFNGWNWTYNFLIVQRLWPLFNPASHTSEATLVATVRLIGTHCKDLISLC